MSDTAGRACAAAIAAASAATFAALPVGAHAAAPVPPPAAPAVCDLVARAPAGALFSVPFRTVDGRIYVEARVNGAGPFTFAVDTGASGMGRADASLVAALGLSVHGTRETSDGVTTAIADTVRIESIDLGGFVRRDLEVIARDYSGKAAPEARFAGIVGRGFFADGLLVIDYPHRRLSFTRRSGLARGADGVLTYNRAFRVPVAIGRVETEGHLDTGANIAFVVPQPLFDRVGGGAAVEAAGSARLTNGRIEMGRATLAGPVRIGAATMSGVEVRVSDRYPELLVGAHALQRVALLIDQRTRTVALCPPEPEQGAR